MPLILLLVALSNWYLAPAETSYFALEQTGEGTVSIEISPTSTPTVTPSPSATPDNSPVVQLSTPTPTKAVTPTPTVAGERTESEDSSDDCDFEYHFDSRDQETSDNDVSVEHDCQQEVVGGSIDNEIDIEVNTGGNSTDDEDSNVHTGDVKIDVSIQNKVK